METLVRLLRREHCSLVVRDAAGNVTLYHKQGVRDLEDLLDHAPATLRGAELADKVVGKAAAGMMVIGGVRQIYAEVMSRLALPLLDGAGISYSFGQLVDHIVIAKGDDRCPLEKIVGPCQTAEEVVATLRAHFNKMKQIRDENTLCKQH